MAPIYAPRINFNGARAGLVHKQKIIGIIRRPYSGKKNQKSKGGFLFDEMVMIAGGGLYKKEQA